MNYDELVAILSSATHCISRNGTVFSPQIAADAIVALQARVAELEAVTQEHDILASRLKWKQCAEKAEGERDEFQRLLGRATTERDALKALLWEARKYMNDYRLE